MRLVYILLSPFREAYHEALETKKYLCSMRCASFQPIHSHQFCLSTFPKNADGSQLFLLSSNKDKTLILLQLLGLTFFLIGNDKGIY